MKFLKKSFVFLLAGTILLAACTQQSGISSQEVQTLVAQTVSAMQTQEASLPTFTPAPTQTSGAEVLPTFTAMPTLPATATPIPPTATAAAALRISKVEDITIPSGTVLQGGQTFVKTWRLTNGGTAAWNADYKIVFTSGDSMGVQSITIGKVVNPGATYEVSVTMTAPVASGSHVANFMMLTPNGYSFGTGPDGNYSWQLRITVQNLFQVTNATVAASPSTYTGTCPTNISLTPTISANGSGVVTYYLKTSSGTSDTYSLTFTATGSLAGTTVSWPVSASGTLTVNVYIDSPNHQDFAVISIPVTCTP